MEKSLEGVKSVFVGVSPSAAFRGVVSSAVSKSLLSPSPSSFIVLVASLAG